MCLYRPNAPWGGELEWQRLSKDHSWRIAEISWVLGSESLKKKSNIPYITTCCSEGFKKNSPSSSKNKIQHIQLSDTTGTSNGTGFYVRLNWKKSFLAANPPDRFSTNRDKKYPMPTVTYTAGSLMLWACFSAGGPGYLVQIHGIMDSIKYQKIKNSKPDCFCKKSYHGPWLDLQSGQ